MAKPNVITKNDLLQSAKQCLVEGGIEKFTLRAVAEKSGVTQGTVYYHFRTKEQLILELVEEICEDSWNSLSQTDEGVLKEAIESAKSRCSYDSFYHKLFITLVSTGFTNEKIRHQLGEMIGRENDILTRQLEKLWSESPIKGVSVETWGIFFNALVDGIALQAILKKDFPIEKTYAELEHFVNGISSLQSKEESE